MTAAVLVGLWVAGALVVAVALGKMVRMDDEDEKPVNLMHEGYSDADRKLAAYKAMCEAEADEEGIYP